MVCQVLNTGLLYSEKAVYLGKQKCVDLVSAEPENIEAEIQISTTFK